ncbi:MAG: HlyD family efflux transporter periplasmic adaptor subunit [Oscillospiraceae bacterium]|nr:HlyD family efflux transporter periplasmic adaptor subunit [Oscillospiraceae bacterium]
MSDQNQRGEELFETLSKNKKQRRKKLIRNVVIAIITLAVILVVAVILLRRNVEARFAAGEAEVQAYTVKTGTIHTVVSGSGILSEEDLEQLTVPEGVEINEVVVDAGDAVSQGDLLATVDMATVMTTLSSLQEQLDDLDDDIDDARGEEASSSVTAGITGRVKRIFAEPGMDVSACMAENGALAVLSLDGYMAVDLQTDLLSKGDTVTVLREDGKELEGSVSAAAGGSATVLVTDNGPRFDEEVTVLASDGTEAGSGKLYIHNPLAVTGYAGTIKTVSAKENAKVNAWARLFTLKDTSFSANYDTLLRERAELEEDLLALLTIYRDGALLAPMDGRISSVEFESEEETAAAASASTASAYSAYAAYGYGTTATTTTASAAATEVDGTAVLTLYPDIAMSITISIDETDILALKEGQKADIEVSSVSEELFSGEVTEISKVADTSTGVTMYSAEITLDKAEGMLPGMTASVDIKIEGVENALIIPIDALHQTSAISYVYTTYDEKTQQYGGMVEVTTGMQNDNEVEILSGLQAGDVIYYTEAPENIFAAFAAMGGMGGGMPGGMGGMGGRPGNMGGGQMPDRGR